MTLPPDDAPRRPAVGWLRIGLTLLVAAGLALALWPQAGAWFTARGQAGAVAGYADAVAGLTAAERVALLAAAVEYNASLETLDVTADRTAWPAYRAQLAVPPSDVMAMLIVPAIDVDVPMFHGTSDDVLDRGAGHLFGTPLPVGGAGTHTVISAHSGTRGDEVFTRLPGLVAGDLFGVEVLGRVLVYRVDQIEVVAADDDSLIRAVPAEDHLTLLTCTPVGINSHRLLVRGVRVEPVPAEWAALAGAGEGGAPGFPWWAAGFLGGVGVTWVLARGLGSGWPVQAPDDAGAGAVRARRSRSRGSSRGV